MRAEVFGHAHEPLAHQSDEPLLFPARSPFPLWKLVFSQTSPPLGHEAKMKLRSKAKHVKAYHHPLITEPLISGHTDTGEEMAVDILGRWLWGIPGYRGHISVIAWPGMITVLLHTTHPLAIEVVKDAAQRLGVTLLESSPEQEEKQG